MSLGVTEIVLILVVVLVLFGGRKIPELAHGLGRAQAEYKKAKEALENEVNDFKVEVKKAAGENKPSKAPVKKATKKVTRKAATKKAAVQATTKKAVAKKPVAKKTVAKKAAVKTPVAKKATTKKTPAKSKK